MNIYETLDVTKEEAEVSRHSIWLPERSLKVPFQYRGRITKYTRPGEAAYSLDTLRHEVAILRAMAELRMAPPIGHFVYFKTLVSMYDDAYRIDPMGAYGYEMADAAKLSTGGFDLRKMRDLPIQGSVSAWNDVLKHGNIVNGYLVDVRRSAFDMLQWMGVLPELPRYRASEEDLEERLRKDGQFPKGERTEPYQTTRLGPTAVIPGAREVVPRAELLGFRPQPGESVLDIGCLTGGMLDYSWRRQAVLGEVGEHAGVDVDEDYVELARDVARYNGQAPCILQRDVCQDTEAFVQWVKTFFHRTKGRPDHLLLLSLEKHLGEETLWSLVDNIAAGTTYIETNAMKEGRYALRAGVEKRGGGYVGDSKDRNVRRLYRIRGSL